MHTLNVPLYVLPLSAGLVTHPTVKCFILRQDTIGSNVGVKTIMLQEHCKVKRKRIIYSRDIYISFHLIIMHTQNRAVELSFRL